MFLNSLMAATHRYKKPLLLLLAVITLLACIAVTAEIAHAAPDEVGAFSDQMLQNYKQKFESYSQKIWNAALALFAILFLCQFAWSIIQLHLQENLTFGSVVATVIRQGMVGSFFYWLLFDRTVLTAIVESFEALGSSGLKASELLNLMEAGIGNIMRAVGKSAGVIAGLALFLTGLSASIVMAFALTTAVAYMMLVQLENYIVGSLGLILLGFGGSDYTRSYAVSYIRTLVHVSFKLFLATVIVQIGVTAFYASTLNIAADNEAISQACMRIIAQSFFFLAIVKVIPMIADSLIGGGSMSSWWGLSTVTGSAGAVTRGMGRAAAGGGSAAYNLPGGIESALQGGRSAVQAAAGAYSSSFNSYRSQGLNPLRAGVSALGSTVWAAYRSSRGAGAGTFGESRNTMMAANSTGGGGLRGSAGSGTQESSGQTGGNGSGNSFALSQGGGAAGGTETASAGAETWSPLGGAENPAGGPSSGGADIAGDAAAGKYGTSGGQFAARAGHGSVGAPEGAYSKLDRNPAAAGSLDTGNVPRSQASLKKTEAGATPDKDPATTPEELSRKFKTWN